MKHCLKILVSLAIMALLNGCGTWIGNPKDPGDEGSGSGTKGVVTIDFAGTSSGSLGLTNTVTVTDSDGATAGSLVLSKAQICLKEIKLNVETALRLKDGEDEDESDAEKTEFSGPFIVDLVNDSVKPEPETIELDAGTYKEIELKMHKLDKGDAEDAGVSSSNPLVEKSIYLSGTYTPTGGAEKDFTLAFELGEEFKIKNNKGVDLEADVETLVQIVFDLDKWFDFGNSENNEDGVDFDDIVTSSIDLDEESDDTAKEVREVIKDNIKDSADFEKD